MAGGERVKGLTHRSRLAGPHRTLVAYILVHMHAQHIPTSVHCTFHFLSFTVRFASLLAFTKKKSVELTVSSRLM